MSCPWRHDALKCVLQFVKYDIPVIKRDSLVFLHHAVQGQRDVPLQGQTQGESMSDIRSYVCIRKLCP